MSVCMYVCGLITQKRLNRLGSNSQRVFSLVPGWFQAKKIRIRFLVRRKNEKNCFGTNHYSNKFSRFSFTKISKIFQNYIKCEEKKKLSRSPINCENQAKIFFQNYREYLGGWEGRSPLPTTRYRRQPLEDRAEVHQYV